MQLSVRNVAAKTRSNVAEQQAAGIVPCFGAHSSEDVHRFRDEHQIKMYLLQNSQRGGRKAHRTRRPTALPCKRAEAWRTSGTATTCQLVIRPTPKVGAERTRLTTEVTCYVPDLNSADPEWRVADVRNLPTVTTAMHGKTTLGVVVGPSRSVADQIHANADVIQAMRERVQLCQDSRTEFRLIRESLGVSVHGRTILEEETARTFDEVGAWFTGEFQG